MILKKREVCVLLFMLNYFFFNKSSYTDVAFFDVDILTGLYRNYHRNTRTNLDSASFFISHPSLFDRDPLL